MCTDSNLMVMCAIQTNPNESKRPFSSSNALPHCAFQFGKVSNWKHKKKIPTPSSGWCPLHGRPSDIRSDLEPFPVGINPNMARFKPRWQTASLTESEKVTLSEIRRDLLSKTSKFEVHRLAHTFCTPNLKKQFVLIAFLNYRKVLILLLIPPYKFRFPGAWRCD